MTYIVAVEIQGVSPLLMNRFPEPDEKPKTRRKSGETTSGWRETAYLLPGSKTELCQPGTHIEAAMAKAASQFRVAGRGRSTYRDLIRASVLVEPDMIPHDRSIPVDSDLTTDASRPVYMDRRPVVIQRARIMKSRVALSAGWCLSFRMRVLDDHIPREVLKEILETAGSAVGIGDFRPKFGRFELKSFELVSQGMV